jgi:hypothetical protein
MIMKKILLPLGILAIITGISATAQAFTTIMSGENSTKLTFGGGGTGSRTTVTSLQFPFYFPSSNVGSSDTPTFASGNSSLIPPWWLASYYTGGDLCEHMQT